MSVEKILILIFIDILKLTKQKRIFRSLDDNDITQYKQINALKTSDTSLKTLLSIGGASFSTEKFKKIASTTATRKKFIDSTILFVRQHNFDGVDIDWEYPKVEDKQNFALFLTELRAAIELESSNTGNSRALLTAAVAAGFEHIDNGYNVVDVATALDYIFLMSYDFHGDWEKAANHHAPLFARKDESDYEKVIFEFVNSQVAL